MTLTHFSLFTGIGGIDLAAEWAGFETVGQCEFSDYPTKVLEKHWPDVPRWRDVRDVTAESIRKRGIAEVTVLSGGFPCQPHSLAGKRLASADERDLWGEFARVIREIKPRWVLGENVSGLLSSENGRFFGRVLRDLAECGYNAGWYCYGAETVGAPHERKRAFIVANASSNGLSQSNKYIRVVFEEKERYTGTWNGRRMDQPGIERVVDGVPYQMDRLKCLGNAVVPQQVYPILQAIADIERGLL